MAWEICPECYEGLHQHCIGQGCYCDCRFREKISSEDGRIFEDEKNTVVLGAVGKNIYIADPANCHCEKFGQHTQESACFLAGRCLCAFCQGAGH